jgi:hypothetical protein
MKSETIKIEGFRPIYKGIAPFMKFEKGFGYYGVLLEEEATGKIQCHLCSHTVFNISNHLRHKHKKISSNEYRVQTGLSLGTPLMSESTRKKIKNNFLNLTESKKNAVLKRLRNQNVRLHTIQKETKRQRTAKASIQTNNRYGTCPEQVRSQFYEKYNELKRVPNLNELSGRLRYIIETRFGSYEEAVVVWGIPRKEYREHILNSQNNALEARKENNFFPKYTVEEIKKQYQGFFKINKRLPTWGEVSQFGMAGRTCFKRAFGIEKSELEKSLILK